MNIFREYAPLVLILLAIPVAGFFAEKVLFYKLRKLSQKTPWGWDKVLVDALRFMPTLWSFLLAIYLLSEEVRLPKGMIAFKDKFLWVIFILSFALLLSRLVGGFLKLYMSRYRE
ncbi:MAG: hypothetical protein ACK42C_08735, partial [Aquificaceae bacterium]